jgi:hypothetical protein
MRRIAILGLLMGLAAAPTVFAQGQPDGRRQALEQRFRQRAAAVVQRRLGLSDEQMRRLGQVNAEMEGQRRELHAQERGVRTGLRNELAFGDSANAERVSRYLDQLIDVQRRRIDLIAREQRALSAFMTPVQRARYLALQDQIRRRMEDARERGGPRRRAQQLAPPQ